MSHQDLLAVPAARREAIEALATELLGGRTVALTTHINADGDGCGSEAALARMLLRQGLDARIVNPTPWPGLYRFLLDGTVTDASDRGERALRGIDALVVLDISDVRRLGQLADAVRALRVPRLLVDHHVPGEDPAGELRLVDTAACATGELVYDMAVTLGWTIDEPVAAALYTAIITDTGGFRFSNTTPRCLAIAADLLAAGVDPERMYRQIYASVPLTRLRLLRDALDSLEADEGIGLSWMSIPAEVAERYPGITSEDFDGIVEHARSVTGTRLAIFFRDLGHGKVKLSLRSTGDVDVNRFARRFGGGGHARAAGALVPGALEEVRREVLEAAREYLVSPDAAPAGGTASTGTPAGP